MALTETEKTRVRELLGYNTAYIDFFAEARMNQLSDTEQTKLRALLASCDAVDAKLADVAIGARAGIVQVDEVTFSSDVAAAARAIRSHGRMVIGRIAVMLLTAPHNDYYGTGIDVSTLPAAG